MFSELRKACPTQQGGGVEEREETLKPKWQRFHPLLPPPPCPRYHYVNAPDKQEEKTRMGGDDL